MKNKIKVELTPDEIKLITDLMLEKLIKGGKNEK